MLTYVWICTPIENMTSQLNDQKILASLYSYITSLRVWWCCAVLSPAVAHGSSTSVLVGVAVGLVVAGVLLVILLVLLWRFKNAKGKICIFHHLTL